MHLYLRIAETDNATLDVVIYYGALEQLLRDENWIQANRLTKRILIKLAYARERSANDDVLRPLVIGGGLDLGEFDL